MSRDHAIVLQPGQEENKTKQNKKENPKDATENLLELINSLKWEDTKSTYKTQLHFNTLIMNHLKKKTIPFIIA